MRSTRETPLTIMSTDDADIGYLSCEQLLFLSPWKPVDLDTQEIEGGKWECPNCGEEREFFGSLARLEGAKGQLMVQCPACDHLNVIQLAGDTTGRLATRYGGPHVDQFLRFLDQRSADR